MTILLDGKIVRDSVAGELKNKILGLEKKLKLAILQVGNKEESNKYIEQKKLFAEKIGAEVIHVRFSEDVSQEKICAEIQKLNGDASVHGIIVQLPLPETLDKNLIIQNIDPIKDVDGLTSANTKLLWKNEKGHVPATARGILTLLDYYKIEIKGKKVVVVGRSQLVGKPVALSFLNRDAIVIVCHRGTSSIMSETKQADILVVAAGNPEFITKDFVREGQVVVDVGINVKKSEHQSEEILHKKVVGDVNFAEVSPIVSAISPVPGGVGPMTVLSLFQNLLDAYIMIEEK
ncbi:bifunctional 5,10-methylenetetrahydrofolate dehydrogenase/5,10-methenyltetrahydrofolate cyclohydrolase [Candidatus Parcubacteria bacterium]|nr:bifunctional 5,10-methylenetetrahydrofolate dehydrogenase/5,10-methenyltetrahydrofolate cyclohydrolase [Candidatus Parcubacteria bacterium]